MNRFSIRNGKCYDPMIHKWIMSDLLIEDGKIVDMLSGEPDHIIDASGCIVMPGLIDYHVHYYRGASENGVNADASSFCCGITTAVDGGTEGVGGYEHFHSTTVTGSEVRILSDLLIASGGQSNNNYSENLNPLYFDEKKILSFFRQYPNNLVALKTRLSRGIVPYEIAEESLRRTVEIADMVKTRVVVHVTDCIIPLDYLATFLRPGDVICHIFHGRGNTCLGEDDKILPGLWEAKERGIIFDVANGRSNFDLEVAGKAIKQGFLPDIISSDNNSSSCFLHPMHVLPRILSKFVSLGMNWEDVLDAATIRPSRLINRTDLGTLRVGTPADVAIFLVKNKKVVYKDLNGHFLNGQEVLVPMMTWKDGKCVYCQADFQ